MARRAKQQTPRRPGRSSVVPWLPLAAAVHAAVLLAAGLIGARAGRDREPSTPFLHEGGSDPLWLDLVGEAGAGMPAAAAANVGTNASSSSSSTAAAEPRAATPASPRATAGSLAHATGPRRPVLHASGVEGASLAAASDDASLSGEGAAPEHPGEVFGSEPGDGAEGQGEAARLSLRELGIDRGSNPFIGSVDEQPTERQRYNLRLRQALRGGIARQDQARGLGPEGPAVAAVTDIVMASATAPNTTALLRVRTDGAGAVTRVDVLEADRDSDEWQRIADRLVRALAGKKLRVAAGSNGTSFQLRVTSRVQLPSGADPGLSIDVLGIPLKKGDGERSTKLSILSPIVTEVEVPDSNGMRVPAVTFSLIGAMGDPTDIGAVARRLVTAYLVKMDTDFLPESALPDASSPAAPASVPAAPRDSTR